MARFPLTLRVEPRLDGLLVTDERAQAAPFRGWRYGYLSIERISGSPIYVPLDGVGSAEMHDGREIRLSPVNHLRTARRAWQRALWRECRRGGLDAVGRVRERRDGIVVILALLGTAIAGLIGGVLYILRWPAWPTDAGKFVLMFAVGLPITVPLLIGDVPRLFRVLRNPRVRVLRCTSAGVEIEREGRPPEPLLWRELRAVKSSVLGLHLIAHDGRTVDVPRSGRLLTLARLAIEGHRRSNPERLRRREKALLVGLYVLIVATPFVSMAAQSPRRDGTVFSMREAILTSFVAAAIIPLGLVGLGRVDRFAKRQDAMKRRSRRRP